ncbi:hypothetical protein Y032_0010g920 [Ancylostoma ceylanicum]|nr:hypothetical protein Y032_0010g920 [Ancylostoma ceylanicum]
MRTMKSSSAIVLYCALVVVFGRPQSDTRSKTPEADEIVGAIDEGSERKKTPGTAMPPFGMPTGQPSYTYGPPYGGPFSVPPHPGPTDWPSYTSGPPHGGPTDWPSFTYGPPHGGPTGWPSYTYGPPHGGPTGWPSYTYGPPHGGPTGWPSYTYGPPYGGPPTGSPCVAPTGYPYGGPFGTDGPSMGHTDQGNHYGQTKHPDHGNGNTKKPHGG